MVISESFQVATIIEKLPPAWNDFKNYLKHKRKEMSMEGMIVKLQIEEDNRVNTVDSNPREWWLDTGATHHICHDKDSFSELVPCDKWEKLYMGNATTSKIKGKGTMVLKMTSSKELKL
ncbi:ankyrin repeat-containing protein [Gossypium australe]|uniref:Ankyrin repeat-containing protein n=1 Tax=Gossypium australe TaxID=47621 RepID=A0A5B6V3Q8_9ROSI|nr:ankyrin repeat-containing protein [Gossypium australe]